MPQQILNNFGVVPVLPEQRRVAVAESVPAFQWNSKLCSGNSVSIVEVAADRGAQRILMPISARKQLFDLPDELATKVTVIYYNDAKDALLKALTE
jgi:predicted ATP-dependent Lon-type protease